MFVILIPDDDSWAQMAITETLEMALAVAPDHAQIEEWDEGVSVIVRAGIYP